MSILMKGADVAKTMKEDLTGEARRLKDRGILPSDNRKGWGKAR